MKFKKSIIYFIVLVSILVVGLITFKLNDNISETSLNEGKLNKITSEEAKKIIDTENDEIILDVRTSTEYEEGHIPNSILIPVDNLIEKANSVINDKNQKILIYCRSGNRSKIAGKILIDLGYTNLYDFGGINDWKYEIE